jgi:LPXTG-motif cell wall-anchored protein
MYRPPPITGEDWSVLFVLIGMSLMSWALLIGGVLWLMHRHH